MGPTLPQRWVRISSTEGSRLVLSLLNMRLSLRQTQKAPVELMAFCSMLSPKQPPINISRRLSCSCWQRGCWLMKGMQLPPMPMISRAVWSIETRPLRVERRGGRGQFSPTTSTSALRQPSLSLSFSKVRSQDQLVQQRTITTGVIPSPVVVAVSCALW